MHSIMFHHFHDHELPSSQGSFSGEDLYDLVKQLQKTHVILDANEFVLRLSGGELKENEVSLTFDDGLKSQSKVAVPVLETLGITAFFFINTGPLTGRPDNFEFFRYIKNGLYDDIETFYENFFRLTQELYPLQYQKLEQMFRADYLSHLRFYSENDRRFKFIRDEILSSIQYRTLLLELADRSEFELPKPDQLWMTRSEITNLSMSEHVIGLHSHSHSAQINTMTYEEQLSDYSQNLEILQPLSKTPIYSVSYPLGRFNEDTLRVMRELDISLGYRNSTYPKKFSNYSTLTMSRTDSAIARRVLQ